MLNIMVYLASDGTKCPYCMGERLSRSTEWCNKTFQNKVVVYCEDCHSEWYDVFCLSGIKEIYDGTNVKTD